MSQSTFIHSIKSTCIARNLIGRRNWSRLKTRSIALRNRSCESGEQERLIGLTQTFEDLTMARLTHFGKIQPGTANDSNFLSSAQQSDETFTEKYTSLTDKVFDLPPLQTKEATPPQQNEDTFGVPTDMNENKNKLNLRLQPVANPFVMPNPMVQSSSMSSAVLSRNFHSDTGQSSMAPRKFTTLLNKVEQYPKIQIERSDSFHDGSDKDSLIKFSTGGDKKSNTGNNSNQKKQRSSGRIRKMGMLLGAATAAASVWSYDEIRKQSTMEEGDRKIENPKRISARFPRVHLNPCANVVNAAEIIELDDNQQNRRGSFGGNSSDDNNSSNNKGLTRRERFNFIAEVVEETAAALVYIEIKDLGTRNFYTGDPMTTSNGSGFIVEKDGLILTNAHVVLNKPRAGVQVRLQDGRTYQGFVEDYDVKSDLATVRIKANNLPVMKLGKSSSVRPGEFVIAMGSPLSLSNTITTGVVSSVARNRAELGLRGKDVPDYLQTDAAITFGNSGGPLLNLDGECIGINSMKVTPGISFAIPIDYAKEFLQKAEEAKSGGWFGSGRNSPNSSRPSSPTSRGNRRYIGITMASVTDQILLQLRLNPQVDLPHTLTHGIIVFKLVIGSPADKAGVIPGDIVTHVNGNEIHESKDVYKLLETEEDLQLTIVRTVHGRAQTYHITVKPE